MKQKVKDFILKNYFWLTLFIFSLTFFFLFPFFRYQINPDGISLINITKKYLTGNFKLAVNGYWSPLISFLLVPFLVVFKEGIISFKILSYFIGLFSIYSFDRFLKNSGVKSNYRKIFLMIILPVVTTHFTLITITSDFITTTFFLFLLSFLVDENIFKQKYSFILVGFIGFLTYLAKTYGFFFFLGLLMILFLFNLIKKDFKNVKYFFLSGIVFIFLSSIWIIAISAKYGYPTLGTTGKFNYTVLTVDTLKLKEIYTHPLPPPDSFSTSFWDDPSYVKHPEINIKMIVGNLNYYLKIVSERTLRTFKLLLSFSLFLPLFFILSIFLFIKKKNRKNLLLIFSASILSFIGYLPVEIERRYIFINFYLIASLFLIILENFEIKNYLKILSFVLISLSFLIMPMKELKSDLNSGKDVYNLYLKLKDLNISGNIASNSNRKNTTYISYYLNLKYFGTFYYSDDEKKFFEDLNTYKISYYFYYGDKMSFLDSTHIIYRTSFQDESLKIYRIDE
ncbi:MAG: hypothetical protein ABIN00_01210 [candidate division WOR-3 bacterium]